MPPLELCMKETSAIDRRRKRVLIAAGLVVLVLIIAALLQMYWFRPRITQAEVRRQIQTGLPMGSTVKQTVAFLSARGWVDPHNVGIYANRDNHSSAGFEQKDPEGSPLLATIQNAYPGFLVSGSILMEFDFNAEGQLTHYQNNFWERVEVIRLLLTFNTQETIANLLQKEWRRMPLLDTRDAFSERRSQHYRYVTAIPAIYDLAQQEVLSAEVKDEMYQLLSDMIPLFNQLPE